MLIEKLVASCGGAAVALLIWKAGNTAMLHFIHIVNGYAHSCDAVAAWGN